MEESKSEGSVMEYMQMAVDQARKGLEANEVPVGCVFVH
jgi:tRNA(Arg) A34 adenosine deaminase TadA